MNNLFDCGFYRDAEGGKLYTSIVYVEEGSGPFVFSGLILRFWAICDNSIRPFYLTYINTKVNPKSLVKIRTQPFAVELNSLLKQVFHWYASSLRLGGAEVGVLTTRTRHQHPATKDKNLSLRTGIFRSIGTAVQHNLISRT